MDFLSSGRYLLFIFWVLMGFGAAYYIFWLYAAGYQ